MIRGFATIEGKYINVDNLEFQTFKNKNDFACLFLEKPSENEVSKACKKFKFQQKQFLNYTKEARSLRYSMKPLVFVFIDYYVEDNMIKKIHVLFAMKKNVLMIVTPHKSKYYTELFNSLVLRLKEEKKVGDQLAHFLYYFLYEDARENYDVLDEMDSRIMRIEESVKQPEIRPKMINEIVKLKRNCFLMNKCLWASAKLIFTIKRGLTPLTLGKDLLTLMDDVYDTLIHQTDLLTIQREILTDLLEIYATVINNKLTVVSNELNSVMKKLTSLTVIIAVPTLIASFYGMNFKYMPELDLTYGYKIVIVIMIIVSAALYFYFHKKRWI